MDNKKWRIVDYGTLNMYRISDEGDIQFKSPGANSKWKDKSIKKGNNGYLFFRIGKKPKSLHREVLTSFIGKPIGDKNTVDHIDFDKANNKLVNLEWVTQLENNRRYESCKLKINNT